RRAWPARMPPDISGNSRQLRHARLVELKRNVPIHFRRRRAASHELQAVIESLDRQRRLFPACEPCGCCTIDLRAQRWAVPIEQRKELRSHRCTLPQPPLAPRGAFDEPVLLPELHYESLRTSTPAPPQAKLGGEHIADDLKIDTADDQSWVDQSPQVGIRDA